MHERMSLRDNRRLEMARSEVASGVQAYRDTLALEYALGLSSGEAEALAQDLVRLRDSKDGFSAVSYRLLRAVHARRRLNDDSPEPDEQSHARTWVHRCEQDSIADGKIWPATPWDRLRELVRAIPG